MSERTGMADVAAPAASTPLLIPASESTPLLIPLATDASAPVCDGDSCTS